MSTRLAILVVLPLSLLPIPLRAQQLAAPGEGVNRRVAESFLCNVDSVRARARVFRDSASARGLSVIPPQLGDDMCEVLAKVGAPAGRTFARQDNRTIWGYQFLMCRGIADACIRTVYIAPDENRRGVVVHLEWDR